MKPLYGNIDEAQYIKELEARCCLAVEKIERLSCENERLKGEGELADKVIADFSCEGRAAKELVDKQAEDAGLWFEARTAPEAYLQAALRQLHEIVEGKSPLECVQDLVSEEPARVLDKPAPVQKELHDMGTSSTGGGMTRKLMCWIGRHDWRFTYYFMRQGGRVGDRCPHCGTWSSDSVIYVL